MKRKYYSVRKMAWDSLWHALYVTDKGHETWDRVSEQEAIEISKKLVSTTFY